MARRFAAVSAVILALALASYASSQECRRHMMGGPGKGPEMMKPGGGPGGHGFFIGMKKELGLSDAQVEKLKSIRVRNEKKAIQDRADVEIMELELRELMSEDDVDVKAVDRKIDQIAAQRAKMQKNRIHAMLEAKKVLKPEQREKLKELRGRRMKKCIERRIEIER